MTGAWLFLSRLAPTFAGHLPHHRERLPRLPAIHLIDLLLEAIRTDPV